MTPSEPQLCSIRSLVIDADGVLWHGHQDLSGVPAFFDFLHRHDIRYIIASNNSARPASDLVERAARLGAEIDASRVLTSAEATAMYLPRLMPPGGRVFLIGGEAINEELMHADYQLVDQNADVVVVGLDVTLTYDKLKRATLEIRRGAKFVGTNGDRTFPATEGLVPGAGSILAALQAATDVEPIIIGKPARAMFDLAVEKMHADAATTAMLGDRLDTDIEGAQRAGLKSMLVMTGVTSPETLERATIRPDWVFPDLPALVRAWQDCMPERLI